MLLKWPWRGAPLLPTRPKGTGLASLSGPVSPRNSGCAVLPREFWAPGLSRLKEQERRPRSSSSIAHCNRTRTACECKLRRASTAHAVLRDLIADMQHEKLPLCAGAHRPPAHLTARSNALGTRAASTVSSRTAPRSGDLTCPRLSLPPLARRREPFFERRTPFSLPEGEVRTPSPQRGKREFPLSPKGRGVQLVSSQ